MADEPSAVDGGGEATSFFPQETEIPYEGVGEDEWVKSVVWDLVLWRQPVLTGLWLVVFFLVFFLLEVSEYSVLTLLSYLILLQLVTATALIRAAPTLKTMGLLRQAFDPKIFAQQRQAFTPEELTRFSRGAAMLAYEAILNWNDALVTRDARKVLRVSAGMVTLAALGIFLSVDLAVLIVVVVGFSVPKIYEMQGDRIDEFTAVLWEAVERRLPVDRFFDLAATLAERLEPVLGSL